MAAPGPPGAPGPRGDGDRDVDFEDSETADDMVSSESSTNVRSNFPETWIWTDATTGYVVHIRVVFAAVKLQFVLFFLRTHSVVIHHLWH